MWRHQFACLKPAPPWRPTGCSAHLDHCHSDSRQPRELPPSGRPRSGIRGGTYHLRDRECARHRPPVRGARPFRFPTVGKRRTLAVPDGHGGHLARGAAIGVRPQQVPLATARPGSVVSTTTRPRRGRAGGRHPEHAVDLLRRRRRGGGGVDGDLAELDVRPGRFGAQDLHPRKVGRRSPRHSDRGWWRRWCSRTDDRQDAGREDATHGRQSHRRHPQVSSAAIAPPPRAASPLRHPRARRCQAARSRRRSGEIRRRLARGECRPESAPELADSATVSA